MTEAENDREYEILSSPMPRVVVTSMLDNPQAVKCPRCWHYHMVSENHDCLCDRCCKVLVEAFPDHPSVPAIQASMTAQREKYTLTKEDPHE